MAGRYRLVVLMAYHILLLCVMLLLVGLKSQLTPIPMYHLSEIRNGIKDNPHDS